MQRKFSQIHRLCFNAMSLVLALLGTGGGIKMAALLPPGDKVAALVRQLLGEEGARLLLLTTVRPDLVSAMSKGPEQFWRRNHNFQVLNINI